MPFKSEAQRRKFQSLVKQGSITQEVYNEWDSKTSRNIPEKMGIKGPKVVQKVNSIAQQRYRMRKKQGG
jgi:hypothetical protein